MARRTIKQRIALDGGKQIKRELEEFGDVGERVFRDLQRAAGQLDGVGDRFVRSLQNAQNALNRASQSIGQLGRNIRGVGRNMSLFLTAPIVAFGAASVKATNDFQERLANVGTLIDNSTESLADMGEKIIEIGKEVPVSFDDLGAALYDVRSASIDAATALPFLRNSAILAFTGLSSVAEAVNIATSAVNAFNLEGPEAERVFNTIFTAVKNGKTTVSDLSNGFGRVAQAVNEAGVSLDEFLAATATLTQGGNKASEAYTQLNQAIASLTKTNKASAAIFEKLGVDTFDELIQKSGGLVQAFQRVREAAGDNSRVLSQVLGSTEAYNAVVALTSEKGLRAFRESLSGMTNDLGLLDREFREKLETPNAQIGKLTNNLQAARIELGEKLLPLQAKLIEAVTKMVDAFNGLSPAMQNTIVVVAGVVAVLGPLVYLVGLLVSGFGLLLAGIARSIGVFSGLFVFLRQIFVQLSGLAGLFRTLLAVSGGFFGLIARGAALAATALAGLASTPALIVAAIVAAGVAIFVFWDEIVAGAKAAYAALTEFFSPDNFARLLDGLQEAARQAGEGLVRLLEIAAKAAVAAFIAQFTALRSFMAGIADEIGRSISDAFSGLGGLARDAFDNIAGLADDFVTGSIATFDRLSGVISTVWDPLESAATAIFSAVETAASFLIDRVAGIFTAGVARVKQAFSLIADVVTSVWSTASDGVRAAADAILDSISRATEIAGDIKGAEELARSLVKPFEDARAQIDKIVASIERLVDAGFGSIESAVDDAARAIRRAIDGIIADLRRAVEQARRLAAEARSARSGGGEGGDGVFARGGYVRGPGTATSDSIPAWLSAGEFVVRAAAVKHYGPGFLRALNQMALTREKVLSAFGRGFSAGGLAVKPRVVMPSLSGALARLSEGLSISAPALALAGGGEVSPLRGGRPINITLPGGETFEMVADESVARKLERFAVNSGTRTAGRKPGWYGR